MRRIGILISVLALIGCASMSQRLDEVRERNRRNLLELSVGMTKGEVLEKMGNFTDTLKTRHRGEGATFLSPRSLYINNPYRVSAYPSDSFFIEVLYYYTDIKRKDGAITDDELTPIILVNDKVSGWGWDYWNVMSRRYELMIR